MATIISATFYAGLSILVAYILRVRSEWDYIARPAIYTWIAFLIPIFFIREPLLVFIAATFILLIFSPKEATDRVAFFLIIFPAMPEFIQYQLPFPGLNYLLNITYLKLAIIVVLLPVLFYQNNNTRSQTTLNAVDIIVILYIVFISLMSLRGLPFTSSLRALIDNIILFAIPYFVISRSITDFRSIEKFVHSFLILAVILSTISIVTEIKHWKFYFLFKEYVHEFDKDIYRFGFLRVGGIIHNPAVIGMFLVIGLLALEYFRQKMRISFMQVWILRLVMLSAVLFSGTRAAILTIVVATLIYVFLSAKKSYVRGLMIFGAIFAVGGYFLFVQTIDFEQIDTHGTFDYRYQLILAALKQITLYPLFGDVNYIASGNFDHLLQGQGIIDIVNYYIQIILEYGIVGLALFVSLFMLSCLSIIKSYQDFAKYRMDVFSNEYVMSSLLLTITVSYTLYMGMISGVSYLPIIGFMLLAILRGMQTVFYTVYKPVLAKPYAYA